MNRKTLTAALLATAALGASAALSPAIAAGEGVSSQEGFTASGAPEDEPRLAQAGGATAGAAITKTANSAETGRRRCGPPANPSPWSRPWGRCTPANGR